MLDRPDMDGTQIEAVRAFNRFYTRQIGLLDEGLLKSDYSLTEARILYELAHRDSATATELIRDLGLDAGYLSRLVKKFEGRGLIERSPTPHDGRQMSIALTSAGRSVFAGLNRDSQAQVGTLLSRLTADERGRLVASMSGIENLLGDRAAATEQESYRLRPLEIGDIGWIIHRQGMLYAEEYGWDGTYEALVAEILASFVRNFDAAWENAWIAERDGAVVGSVFLVRKSDEVAKLRLLYVEPSARGLGLGKRLVDECVAFARARRYRTLTLWTNDILVSARRIYQAAGFRLVEEERHHSFGKDLVGQTWDLTL